MSCHALPGRGNRHDGPVSHFHSEGAQLLSHLRGVRLQTQGFGQIAPLLRHAGRAVAGRFPNCDARPQESGSMRRASRNCWIASSVFPVSARLIPKLLWVLGGIRPYSAVPPRRQKSHPPTDAYSQGHSRDCCWRPRSPGRSQAPSENAPAPHPVAPCAPAALPRLFSAMWLFAVLARA